MVMKCKNPMFLVIHASYCQYRAVLQKQNSKPEYLLDFCNLLTITQRIKNSILSYLFRYLALTRIMITMVQCFEFPSNKDISDSICIIGHNTNVPPPTFHINYSSMELVLFEKLPNIKLSRSMYRVTTFFQFLPKVTWKP